MDTETLEKLIDISRSLAEKRILAPLLGHAMDVALNLLNGQYGYLILLTPKGELEFRIRQDWQGNQLDNPEEQVSRTIFDQVISRRQPLLTADAVIDPTLQQSDSVMSLGLRSVMCVPLIAHERLLGALYMENRSEREIFDEDDLKTLGYFAASLAVSIENAQFNEELERRVEEQTLELKRAVEHVARYSGQLLSVNKELANEVALRRAAEEQLREMAITDPLTGVFNRRHFMMELEKSYHHALRYKEPLTMLMVDADRFKNINDIYGHLVGDEVLKALAAYLTNSIRAADTMARYGGEEFAILMPSTPLVAAQMVANRLCAKIASQPVQVEEHLVKLTVSVGVAEFAPEHDKSLTDVLAKADQALYVAKRNGRNRVEIWRNGLYRM